MPWKKGQTGNPKGRPKKGRTLADFLERRLMAKDDVSGRPHRELIVEALVEAGESGNVPAIREILDRIDGPVPIEMKVHEIKVEVYTVVVRGFIALFNEANQLQDPEARRALFAIGADRLVAAGFPGEGEADGGNQRPS